MAPLAAAALLARPCDPTPHGRLLSNGRHAVLLTADGSGFSRWNGVALTAWRGDRVADGDGLWLWLRDAESGRFASLGRRPGGGDDAQHTAEAAPGRMTLACAWDGLDARLDACVAPDLDLELRRIAVRNASGRPRRLELCAAAELVLDAPAAFAAHPAFSKLFVETARAAPEADEAVLLARRRPRSADDPPRWLAAALLGPGALACDTDRVRVLGRGRSWTRPRFLEAPDALAGTVGPVLDPVLAWRRAVELAAGDEAVWTLALAAGTGRGAVLAALAGAGDPRRVAHSFEAAAEREASVRAALGMDDVEADAAHALAVAALYGHPALRAPLPVLRRTRGALAALAAQGLAADRLLVAVLAGPRAAHDGRALLRALAFWHAHGMGFHAVLLAESPEALAPAVPRGEDVRIELRALRDVAPAEQDRLLAAARIALPDGRLPPLEALVSPAGDEPPPTPRFRPPEPDADAEPPPAPEPALANGFGRFADDDAEYEIVLDPDAAGRPELPPMPWCNVIANERAGVLVSERGSANTWAENSRENRLTPWSNDPVADPCDEALWLRDEEAGCYWSPLPGPTPAPVRHRVRHGLGYTLWSQDGRGLHQEVVRFVPADDAPVAITRVRLADRSGRPRRLTWLACQRLVLGGTPEASGRFVVTDRDPDTGALLAESHFDPGYGAGVAFGLVLAPGAAGPLRFTTDRAAFVGRGGTPERPAAVAGGAELDGALGAGLDPCFAWQVPIALAPGGAAELWLLLGHGRDLAEARAWAGRFRDPDACADALAAVHASWRQLREALRVETPVPALDHLLGGWLVHQTLSCRLRGRTAFYQSGGAFGFRDQLQDAAALVWVCPERVREQILLHAAHQFVEGDVLHWWHPPTCRGIRTRFADDLAWLPYVTASYVEHTGDEAVLDEPVAWLEARPLAPGEDEAFVAPARTEGRDPLWEHCCRALERAMTRGPHGLPLMGTGDWNDGMNRVGREGRGESVWMGFFLHHVIDGLAPLAERRGEHLRADAWRRYQREVRAALEEHAWDGAWYRRAWYDDGTPLGTAEADECRIDALVQAWAVISGAAPRVRAERAMDSVMRHLVDDEAGIVRLLAPPFDRTAQDPGYIRGYVPGIRENGGQYTHAALWVVRALAELGRHDEAVHVLERLTPVWHTRSREAVAIYRTEPYWVAADVYGVPPHVGRGGWTGYTGSAGWLLRVVLESILGLRVEAGRVLVVEPRLPATWPGYDLVWRPPHVPGSVCRVRVRRDGAAPRKRADERPPERAAWTGAARVPLEPGAEHACDVLLRLS